jgi:hypothetical protein
VCAPFNRKLITYDALDRLRVFIWNVSNRDRVLIPLSRFFFIRRLQWWRRLAGSGASAWEARR